MISNQKEAIETKEMMIAVSDNNISEMKRLI